MSDPDPLERLRQFCLMLPEAREVDLLGSPAFRVATNTFAVLEQDEDGAPVVRIKCAPEDQDALVERAGYEAVPDTGRYGWTHIRLDAGLGWDEVDEAVLASYRYQAPDHLRARLDLLLDAARADEEH